MRKLTCEAEDSFRPGDDGDDDDEQDNDDDDDDPDHGARSHGFCKKKDKFQLGHIFGNPEISTAKKDHDTLEKEEAT